MRNQNFVSQITTGCVIEGTSGNMFMVVQTLDALALVNLNAAYVLDSRFATPSDIANYFDDASNKAELEEDNFLGIERVHPASSPLTLN